MTVKLQEQLKTPGMDLIEEKQLEVTNHLANSNTRVYDPSS